MRTKIYLFFITSILVLLQVSCKGDTRVIEAATIQVNDQTLDIIINDDEVNTLSFYTSDTWTISIIDTVQTIDTTSVSDTIKWLNVSQLDGNKGNNIIEITALPNKLSDRKGYIVIQSGGSEIKLGVLQKFGNGMDDIVITDLNFRAFCLQNFDENQDGYLSFKEVQSIKNLYLNSLHIKSLNGIEYFTNLEVLNCRYNELTELDLARNKKLETLFCSNNQIQRLDLSQNQKLRKIDVSENYLTELNLGAKNNLGELFFYSNKLTHVDLSSCPLLYYLQSYDNQISSLDISSNSKLAGLYGEDPNLEEIWLTEGQRDKIGLFYINSNTQIKYK